jgi:hypothetical protein
VYGIDPHIHLPDVLSGFEACFLLLGEEHYFWIIGSHRVAVKSITFWEVTPCGALVLLSAYSLLVTCFAYSSIMKMEALSSSETLVIFCLTNSFTSQNIVLHRLRGSENWVLGKMF